MDQGIAFEAADHAAGIIDPAGDLLLFVAAGALVLAAAVLLLLGARAHLDTAVRLERLDGIVAAGEGREKGPDA